jgi:hypothetical protein
MTLADSGHAIARRQRNREVNARFTGRYDAAIPLAAPGAAPVGLGSTGNPFFNVPASMLGIPALSLPVLAAGGCRSAGSSWALWAGMPVFLRSPRRFAICSGQCQARPARLRLSGWSWLFLVRRSAG